MALGLEATIHTAYHPELNSIELGFSNKLKRELGLESPEQDKKLWAW